MKYRLLADIRFDLAVCEIEGWDKAEYLSEIKNMIDELGGEKNGTEIIREGVSCK